MKSFKTSLTEAPKSQVVVSFGRMNPMTNGHEKLADKIKAEAKKRNADAKLYLSHSTNPKKDPLDFKTKVKFAKKAFGPMVQNSAARTIIEVAKELTGKYDDLIVVVGSDRIPEFKTLLNKYNGKDFTFKTIEVVSAGERDPDAEGVSGMSGSKMRGFVTSNDFNSFKQGVPSKLSDSDAKALFDAVKRGMNLKEELETENVEDTNVDEVLSVQGRRKRSLQVRRLQSKLLRARERSMRRFASQPTLKNRARRQAVTFLKRRIGGGKAYNTMSTAQKISIDKKIEKMSGVVGKISQRLIPNVRRAEIQRKQNQNQKESVNESFLMLFEEPKITQDKDVAHRKGTQPSKYYSGVEKTVKQARAAHFEKTGPKSDSDPAAYGDAPGDKEAREKGMQQSVHTKRFKQMYGEEVSKKEISRLDQLVRLGLADKTMLSTIKRAMQKIDSGDTLSSTEKQATQNLLSTLLDMVTSQDQLFNLAKASLRKEQFNELDEAAYVGNIGIMELAKFYKIANIAQIETFKKLLAMKDYKRAWAITQSVTGTKLIGKEFNESVQSIVENDDYEELDGLEMAQIEVANLIQDADYLAEILSEMNEEPDAWVLSKITKAVDYIETVTDYLEFEGDFDRTDDDEEDEYNSYEVSDTDMYEALSSMSKEEMGEELSEVYAVLHEEIEGLKKKSEKSGISYGILKQVYNRGMAAWQTGHRPGTTPQQWAFARVNSFITKGSGTWGGADSDLASKVRGSGSKKEEVVVEENKRIPRKPGQPANSDKHSDLYTDENPKDTIQGLKFATKEDAEASVNKIKSSGRSHAHKVQAAVAMEQRAKEMGKTEPAGVYRSFINSMKNKNEAFEKFTEALEYGTDKLRKKYASDTPGQSEEACCDDCEDGELVEAEYQGKTVKLNDPFRTPDGPKKFGVYTMGPNGNIVVVRFGDPNMEIKRDDPARRASFRARHGCDDDPGPKYKAKYWSCQMWTKGKTVSDLD